MPFNYLSTVINTEPDTQPEERESERESEMGREKEREQTTEGGTAKISHPEKSSNPEFGRKVFVLRQVQQIT